MDEPCEYYDLQINGYGGVNFSDDDLTADALHLACEKLAADGTRQFLATIVTAPLDRMIHRISSLLKLRDRDALVKKMIPGFHIEGPFISDPPGYVGAHPPESTMSADPDSAQRLVDAGNGLVKLLTLAPERDVNLRTTRMLVNQGIVVSAGHCNPDLDLLKAAVDAGLSMFTHLGNGCPMHLNRHDNIIQRVLSLADRIWCCFIADGAHVAFPALRNYLKCAGIDRCIVVTDAMTATGLGPGCYQHGRWKLTIGQDLVARAPDGSHLVGSCLTMTQAVVNLVEQDGLTRQQVRQLTHTNPHKAV